MSVMLYKHPGPVELPQHGGSFETLVVMEGEVGARMAEGWHRTPAKALAAHDASEPVAAVIDLPKQEESGMNVGDVHTIIRDDGTKRQFVIVETHDGPPAIYPTIAPKKRGRPRKDAS